jgi:hypothetical protein
VSDSLRLGLGGLGVYQDEVIDASSIDFSGPIRVRVNSYSIEPTLRWLPTRGWAVIVSASGESNSFRDFDDFADIEGAVKIEREVTRGARIFAKYVHTGRDYDSRPQVEAGGRPVDGTILAINQDRGELGLKLDGSADSGWHADIKAVFMTNRDDYSGWYDYDRQGIEAAVSLERKTWSVECEAGWLRYDYDVQTVGFGIDPPKRERTEWSGRARGQYTVWRQLAAFVEVEATDSRSNDLFLNYTDLVTTVGLRWSL